MDFGAADKVQMDTRATWFGRVSATKKKCQVRKINATLRANVFENQVFAIKIQFSSAWSLFALLKHP